MAAAGRWMRMENQSVPGQLDLLAFTADSSSAQSLPDPQPETVSAPLAEGQSEATVGRDQDSTPETLSATEHDPAQGQSQTTTVPSTLLILDTETTGLNPDSDHCLEVGAILFDVSSRQVLAQLSFLLPVQANAAEPINRIPASVTTVAQPWAAALQYFQTLVDAADVLVAHNAAFDRQWFGRGHLPPVSKPWLCSMEEMRWPADRQLRPRPSVRDLALAYDIPVWAAHRALTDCIYLADVFRRCDDLEQRLAHGLEPRSLFKAQVSYDERHLAREAGFRWNDPVAGAWTRRLSAREAEALSFAVQKLDTTLPMAS